MVYAINKIDPFRRSPMTMFNLAENKSQRRTRKHTHTHTFTDKIFFQNINFIDFCESFWSCALNAASSVTYTRRNNKKTLAEKIRYEERIENGRERAKSQ